MFTLIHNEDKRKWEVLQEGRVVEEAFQFYVSEPRVGRLAVHTIDRPVPVSVVPQAAKDQLSEIVGDTWKLDGEPVGNLEELILAHDGRILAERT